MQRLQTQHHHRHKHHRSRPRCQQKQIDHDHQKISSLLLSDEKQYRRCQILLSHIQSTTTTSQKRAPVTALEPNYTTATTNTTNHHHQHHHHAASNHTSSSGDDDDDDDEKLFLNLIPLALISQLTGITTRSLDIYRNALYRLLSSTHHQKLEHENDKSGDNDGDDNDDHDPYEQLLKLQSSRFDLQSWTYSLSKIAQNVSFLIGSTLTRHHRNGSGGSGHGGNGNGRGSGSGNSHHHSGGGGGEQQHLIGIKNSCYMSTGVLALCHLSLFLLLNPSLRPRVNHLWSLLLSSSSLSLWLSNSNSNNNKKQSVSQQQQQENEQLLLLNWSQQVAFVLLNCLSHVSSGILERNALVIVQAMSNNDQKTKLMTALYFILVQGTRIWCSPVQSYVIERYGVSVSFLVTALFCLACMPLFSLLEIKEMRGGEENWKLSSRVSSDDDGVGTRSGDGGVSGVSNDTASRNYNKNSRSDRSSSSSSSSSRRQSENTSSKEQRQQRGERLNQLLKVFSFVCLLFSSHVAKDILQSQSHATLQVCGRMGQKTASGIGSLISISHLTLNKLFNVSDQFVARTTGQQNLVRHSFSLLLLLQCSCLALAIVSKSTRMFGISFSIFSICQSVVHHHLIKCGLRSGGGYMVSLDHGDDDSWLPRFTKTYTYALPILSAMAPSIFSLIRNKWLSGASGGETRTTSPLRMNLIMLFVVQAIASSTFSLIGNR